MVTWRSERMCAGTMVLPVEGARRIVDGIGHSVNVQFRDEHCPSTSSGRIIAPSSFDRPYKKFTQRIEELERIVRYLQAEIDNFGEDERDSPICSEGVRGGVLGGVESGVCGRGWGSLTYRYLLFWRGGSEGGSQITK
eukprot:g12716.t1